MRKKLTYRRQRNMRTPFVPLLLSILILLHSESLFAGSRINNVLLDIGPDGRGFTEVVNIDPSPLGYVVTPLSWKVVDGKDEYAKTPDFIAVPPSFQLKPGEAKIVRVGFRSIAKSDVERTYRLSIREVPSSMGSDGVSLVYDHLIPVYVAPSVKVAQSDLHWSIRKDTDGIPHLRVENRGNIRARIKSILLIRGGKTLYEATSDQWSAVLAKTWREIPLDAKLIASGPVTIEAALLTGQVVRSEIPIP